MPKSTRSSRSSQLNETALIKIKAWFEKVKRTMMVFATKVSVTINNKWVFFSFERYGDNIAKIEEAIVKRLIRLYRKEQATA
jgi:hypothetical protein